MAHIVMMTFIALVIGMTMIVGTSETLEDIVEKSQKYGAPFSCHA